MSSATLRTFIAIELSDDIRICVQSTQERLKASNADVKWVNPAIAHLTLCFLGDVESGNIDTIAAILGETLREAKSFEIRTSDIGAFPSLKHPRVIWLGIDTGADVLSVLAAKIRNGLKDLGNKKDEKEFSAHIALGRVRSGKNLPTLCSALHNTTPSHPALQEVRSITLFKSNLMPSGPIYTPLWKFIFS